MAMQASPYAGRSTPRSTQRKARPGEQTYRPGARGSASQVGPQAGYAGAGPEFQKVSRRAELQLAGDYPDVDQAALEKWINKSYGLSLGQDIQLPAGANPPRYAFEYQGGKPSVYAVGSDNSRAPLHGKEEMPFNLAQNFGSPDEQVQMGVNLASTMSPEDVVNAVTTGIWNGSYLNPDVLAGLDSVAQAGGYYDQLNPPEQTSGGGAGFDSSGLMKEWDDRMAQQDAKTQQLMQLMMALSGRGQDQEEDYRFPWGYYFG